MVCGKVKGHKHAPTKNLDEDSACISMNQLYPYFDWYIWYIWNTNMEIVIDIEDSAPLFTQLIEQIKDAVVSEKLNPGDPLPSIRQLANDLDVNNKTVAKAYRLLERDNVIETKGYRGTFIHPSAKDNCGTDIGAVVTAKLEDAISNCRKAGATDSEIRIAFGNIMQSRDGNGDQQ